MQLLAQLGLSNHSAKHAQSKALVSYLWISSWSRTVERHISTHFKPFNWLQQKSTGITRDENRQVATCLAFVEARTMQSVVEFSLKTCTASMAKVQLQWQWYQNLWSYCWNHVACQQSEQLVDLCLHWIWLVYFGVMVGSPFDKILVKLSQLSQVHFVSAGPVNTADSDWVGTTDDSRWFEMITDGQFMTVHANSDGVNLRYGYTLMPVDVQPGTVT